MAMSVFRRVGAKLHGLFVHRGEDPNFNAELQEHLTLLTERYIHQGMTPQDAARAARLQFGNTTLLQEERREMQTIPMIESLC